MKFKQFYLECLSHASYYLGSGGEAAVIDPQRDVEQYINEADENGQIIKYVIETHSHADFVSGHLELAARTGARIIYGERAETEFPTLKVKDGDTIRLGTVELTFLETPGHTPESIVVLAKDTDDPASAAKMFTGDTLFIGDVGRPDLIGSKGFTSEQMASMLYDSLHEKILTLPDETEIYPAHGAGSLCGKSLSKETWSTLGEQRRQNYALKPMSREEFIAEVSSDQPKVPSYFQVNAARNLQGAPALRGLTGIEEVSADDAAKFDGVIVDVRQVAKYGDGHVPNSINIGLGGQFASWAGTTIPIGTPLLIAAEDRNQVDEAVTRLARVGHENVKGYLLYENNPAVGRSVEQIGVEVASGIVGSEETLQFIDVRRPSEYEAGHARGAMNIPLDRLSDDLGRLDPSIATYVICQSGYRSSLATGLLAKAGFDRVLNVSGGTKAWIEKGLPTQSGRAEKAPEI